MSLTAGIVGLPNVGKSTLFNAITNQKILAENYPFATIEPNVGIVTVPDERMNKLKEMYEPERFIPTAYEFTDIAGLVKGASQGEGLGNKFLSHIREVDAIVEVVRCFEDGKIIHVDGNVDPIRDIETINLELAISDLEIINGRLERVAKKARTTKDKDDLLEVEALERSKKALEENIPLRQLEFSEDERKVLKS
ncbi:MAG: 50S ribosome-binding GTPase, partial [Bacilli bacterium]|nr:50S ribosome-binding GTPase [Bacilli bacterium]